MQGPGAPMHMQGSRIHCHVQLSRAVLDLQRRTFAASYPCGFTAPFQSSALLQPAHSAGPGHGGHRVSHPSRCTGRSHQLQWVRSQKNGPRVIATPAWSCPHTTQLYILSQCKEPPTRCTEGSRSPKALAKAACADLLPPCAWHT